MENETNNNTNPPEETKPLDPSIQFTSPPKSFQDTPNFPIQSEPQIQAQRTEPLVNPTPVVPTPPQPEINPQFTAPINPPETAPAVPNIKYAGFWIRWVASFIDGIILQIIGFIIGFFLGLILGISGLGKIAPVIGGIFGLIVGWIYYIWMTKAYQATLGKMAVGIKVVSDKADILTLGQVILRETIGKIVSAVILGIGYIMTGFTERKQALHDKIANTVVIYKDPEKKVKSWVIVVVVLAMIGFMVVIIGILAPIVLVSLNSARQKASDAAVKSTVLAEIPSALLYADSRGSFSGFIPLYNNDSKIIACSGKPIANVSPDGKNIAIFGKLCSDPKKYFCGDANLINEAMNNAEVDEQYVLSGANSCNNDQKNPDSQGLTNKNSQSDIQNSSYSKAVDALGESASTEIKLKNIGIDGSSEESSSKIDYIFVSGDKGILVEYDKINKTAKKKEEANINDPSMQKILLGIPTDQFVPISLASLDFDNVRKILESNNEYINYKAKNPEVFNQYLAGTTYDVTNGWRWNFLFVYLDKNNKNNRKAISFAVDPEKNKVVVLDKTGMKE